MNNGPAEGTRSKARRQEQEPDAEDPPLTSARSTCSRRSRASTTASQRAKADLEIQKLELEKIIVKQKIIQASLRVTELDNADGEEERRSEASAQTSVIVDNWLQNAYDAQRESTREKVHDDQLFSDLTRAITAAVSASTAAKTDTGDKLLGRLSARNLPTFSGNPTDWLRFKNAFKTTTDIGQYNEAENISRLQRCLSGEAWEAVSALLITTTSADEVISTLEMRFGRPELILHKLIDEIKRIPKLTGARSELIVLATKVCNCVSAIEATSNNGYLHSNELASEVMSKLTEPLIYRWLDYNADIEESEPRLQTLSRYLMHEAKRVCKGGAVELPLKINRASIMRRPVLNMIEDKVDTDTENETVEEINAVSEHPRRRRNDKKKVDTPDSCQVCKEDHPTDTCQTLLDAVVDKRWDVVCEKRLCFRCLNGKHRRDRCKSKQRCVTCQGNHNSILHRDDLMRTTRNDVQISEVTANVWAAPKRRVLLKVLPVTLEGPAGAVDTYALLDEGSTVTLVEQKIADEIGARGVSNSLSLRGPTGNSNILNSEVVTLTLRSKNGETYVLDRVRTMENLSLPPQSFDQSYLEKFTHLHDIPIESCSRRPTILIGQDFWELIITRDFRRGRKNEPVASLTRLGWVLHGCTSATTKNTPEFSLHLREDCGHLDDMMKGFFALESIGIRPREHKRLSTDERHALHILDTKSKKVGDRWETGLLWKSEDVELPNNKTYAENRLRSVERTLDSDPAAAADYVKQVTNFLDKDYAEKVQQPLTGKRVWYLPHFGVRNPNKPGKLRLVFDAKAETKGKSLNSELLTGPDLLNSLIGVLIRFRERQVAVSADIREMFLQIKIIEEDQKAQLFFWRGMDRTMQPQLYKMTSMTFGATSSPCTATYILRRNADAFATSHPRAVAAIKRRHYVDDYLDSVDTEEEMKQLVTDVTNIHLAGGFDIRGWASNRPNVLPQQTSPDAISLLQQDNAMERTLGLTWTPSTDKLGFDLSLKKIKREVAEGLRRPTKREMLKIIMSVFDPLGILSPLSVRGKMLLQLVWRTRLEWDQIINDEIAQKWFQWLEDLKRCKNYTIPRCFGFKSFDKLELHTFVDASEQAYAAVVYLRQENYVAFVAAKSRVAPIKTTTIPRLELQAALMGARLGATAEREIDERIGKRVFWTDSQTVWRWIRGNPRQNQAFVSNRLSEIDELTVADEWRWLPGGINVADVATRSEGHLEENLSWWVTGPEFLHLPEENWPPEPTLELQLVIDEGEEVALVLTEPEKIIDFNRFSNWRRIVASLARALLFVARCKKSKDTLSPNYYDHAEITILRQAQAESFGRELTLLKTNRTLKIGHKLLPLNPEISSETGLMHARSRLEARSELPMGLRKPVILDGRHRVTLLIVENKHRELGHHGTETLINEIRQRYYIFRLRGLTRKIIANCVICRLHRAKCERPQMAGLPRTRLESHCRPFTNIGIDFFGPMMVTIGRRHEKRWGVLFTCFNTRAVHIELAASLSTDSSILAIRRMAARRGYPRRIHSDNATNFHGADKELKASVKAILEDERITEGFSSVGVEWRFNPPDAPHMGGVWERLVRSIKVALYATLNSRAPKEEVLLTLLAEAENIVNSRPLTHVSLSQDEEEALTPNHFLLGSSNGLPKPGRFTDDDLSLRKQWRIAQRLTDHFWTRWIKEYLPSLQTRTTWPRDEGQKIEVGDIVLIVDKNSPRNTWPRGKIIQVIPGSDGRVRIADVATRGGTLRRPASKIIVLMKREGLSQLPTGPLMPAHQEEEIVAGSLEPGTDTGLN